jgi:hypothetical protein
MEDIRYHNMIQHFSLSGQNVQNMQEVEDLGRPGKLPVFGRKIVQGFCA